MFLLNWHLFTIHELTLFILAYVTQSLCNYCRLSSVTLKRLLCCCRSIFLYVLHLQICKNQTQKQSIEIQQNWKQCCSTFILHPLGCQIEDISFHVTCWSQRFKSKYNNTNTRPLHFYLFDLFYPNNQKMSTFLQKKKTH